jgi:hypothetical protein
MSFRKRSAEIPEEKISLLAEQIEEVVLNVGLDAPTASDYQLDPETGDPVGEFDPTGLIGDTDEIRSKIPALAELNVDNEVMLAAIRGRILRRPAVQKFEKNGCLGESRNGLLYYMRGDWCTGDRDLRNRAAYIALSENHDRRTIYDQLIRANDLSGSAMPRIRELFVEQIHKKAWAGTPLQMPDGTWERK